MSSLAERFMTSDCGVRGPLRNYCGWVGYALKLRIAVVSSDCTSKTVNRRVICRMS
jgi:hypothetical protein